MKTIITIIALCVAFVSTAQTKDDIYFMLNASRLTKPAIEKAIKSEYGYTQKESDNDGTRMYCEIGTFIVSQIQGEKNYVISLIHSNFDNQLALQELMSNSDEFKLLQESSTDEGYMVYVFMSDWAFVSLAYDMAKGNYVVICSRK